MNQNESSIELEFPKNAVDSDPKIVTTEDDYSAITSTETKAVVVEEIPSYDVRFTIKKHRNLIIILFSLTFGLIVGLSIGLPLLENTTVIIESNNTIIVPEREAQREYVCSFEETDMIVQRVSVSSGADCEQFPLFVSDSTKTTSFFACDLVSPRQIDATSVPNVGDVVFVGTRKFMQRTPVYVLIDSNNDGRADERIILEEDLDQPNGVVWVNNMLYVATAVELFRYEGLTNVLKGLSETFKKVMLNEMAFPNLASMQWHYLGERNGNIYASNSAGCDHCLPDEEDAASIVFFSPDACFEESNVYASGIRFSVGFDFDQSGMMIFTNNAHDSVEGDEPWDSINKASERGLHFGFPYCYVTKLEELNFTSNVDVSSNAYYHTDDVQARYDCTGFEPGTPIGQNIAPLGVAIFSDKIYVAERGAFGSTTASGYKVSVAFENFTSYEPYLTGFINETTLVSWGRPVDVDVLGDSLIVSEDKSGTIIKVG